MSAVSPPTATSGASSGALVDAVGDSGGGARQAEITKRPKQKRRNVRRWTTTAIQSLAFDGRRNTSHWWRWATSRQFIGGTKAHRRARKKPDMLPSSERRSRVPTAHPGCVSQP